MLWEIVSDKSKLSSVKSWGSSLTSEEMGVPAALPLEMLLGKLLIIPKSHHKYWGYRKSWLKTLPCYGEPWPVDLRLTTRNLKIFAKKQKRSTLILLLGIPFLPLFTKFLNMGVSLLRNALCPWDLPMRRLVKPTIKFSELFGFTIPEKLPGGMEFRIFSRECNNKNCLLFEFRLLLPLVKILPFFSCH